MRMASKMKTASKMKITSKMKTTSKIKTTLKMKMTSKIGPPLQIFFAPPSPPLKNYLKFFYDSHTTTEIIPGL